MSSVRLTYSRNELLPEQKRGLSLPPLDITLCPQTLNPQLSEAELLLQRAGHFTRSYHLVNLERGK